MHQEDLVRLDYWPSRFVYEARRQDGKPYLGSTLKNIPAGIQRILTEKVDSTTTVNLFKKDDMTFRTFRQSPGETDKGLVKGLVFKCVTRILSWLMMNGCFDTLAPSTRMRQKSCRTVSPFITARCLDYVQ